MLCTIATASKKKGLWVAAIVAGLLGALFVLNGLGHFVNRPEDSKKLGPKLGIQEPLKPAK